MFELSTFSCSVVEVVVIVSDDTLPKHTDRLHLTYMLCTVFALVNLWYVGVLLLLLLLLPCVFLKLLA